LTLDTKVIRNGEELEIRNLKIGDYIESMNGPVEVQEILPIIKQPVFEIKLKSGKTIKISNKHKFPTKTGLKSLEEGLTIGDMLYSINKNS
jgi:intein/homing endonuclease